MNQWAKGRSFYTSRFCFPFTYASSPLRFKSLLSPLTIRYSAPPFLFLYHSRFSSTSYPAKHCALTMQVANSSETSAISHKTGRSYNRCRAAHNLSITSHQAVNLIHGIYSRYEEKVGSGANLGANTCGTNTSIWTLTSKKDHTFPQHSPMHSLRVHPDYVYLSVLFPSLVSFSSFLSLFLWSSTVARVRTVRPRGSTPGRSKNFYLQKSSSIFSG